MKAGSAVGVEAGLGVLQLGLVVVLEAVGQSHGAQLEAGVDQTLVARHGQNMGAKTAEQGPAQMAVADALVAIDDAMKASEEELGFAQGTMLGVYLLVQFVAVGKSHFTHTGFAQNSGSTFI